MNAEIHKPWEPDQQLGLSNCIDARTEPLADAEPGIDIGRY